MTNTYDRMRIEPKLQKEIVSRFEKDTEFLKDNSLMDYSLLLVFFKKQKNDEENPRGYSMVIKKNEHGDVEVEEVKSKNSVHLQVPGGSRGSASSRDQDVKPELSNNSFEFDIPKNAHLLNDSKDKDLDMDKDFLKELNP